MRASRAVLSIALVATVCFATAAQEHKPIHPQQAGTRMKPVICRVIEEGRGKTAQELAGILEQDGARLAQANYLLAAVVPGDAPIACYRGAGDASSLPKGAR